MTMTNGKMNNQLTFRDLFDSQKVNQLKMLKLGMYDGFRSPGTDKVPVDDPKLMSYHVQQLVSEIGEVLDADKRWKNFRNAEFDYDAKLEEIADCFIVLMNVAIFSNIEGQQLAKAIEEKLNKVQDRIQNERKDNRE